MAGDWIKVEHATIDKPEVQRAAEMLGMSVRECLGLFFEFWVWLDKNLSDSCPDFVRNVSRNSLDLSMNCPGFAATLEVIGWCKWDDEGWVLWVSNAQRHNGKTAKSRALDAERKRVSRAKVSGFCPENVRPREEKRREEIHIPSAPVPKDRSSKPPLNRRCPADFGISERVMKWAVANGHENLDAHFAYFMSYVKRKAPKYADWDEALMNAIRENWAKVPVNKPRLVAL